MTEDRTNTRQCGHIAVPADESDVHVCTVTPGETISFRASGRWIDWWIPAGPEGYRLFAADALGIAPRVAGAPFMCLCGVVKPHGRPFRIGRGTTITVPKTGESVHVFANDARDRYANNRGQIRLEFVRGGIAASDADEDAEAYGGWAGAFKLVHRTFDGIRGVPAAALLVIGVSLVLLFLQQGLDLVRSVSGPGSPSQRILFPVTLLFLAIQIWFWARIVIESNFGPDRRVWRPRGLLVWMPRILGFLPLLLVGFALIRVPEDGTWLVVSLILLAALFMLIVIKRQDWLERLRRRSADHDRRLLRLRRLWVGGGLMLAPILILIVSLTPVVVGRFLGAPAVVFVGLGFIIPPVITAVQLGRGLRLPVGTFILIWLVLLSAWVDNHEVGRRAFGRTPVFAPAQRISLDQAYAAWRAAQHPSDSGPMPIVLVASEGGASRAGDWTAEALSALDDKSQGGLRKALFAISAVSGGSVGAVGYAAHVHGAPGEASARLASNLTGFTSTDVLSPVMAGLLFPDLFQSLIPFPLLPDRAEALERGWETAWDENCSTDAQWCRGLMRGGFTQLGPTGTHWEPFVIVNGASEETGRRIVTSKVDLRGIIDADDFLSMAGHDVAVSTAIHNGARFPWVSPAGTIRPRAGKSGHIVDGGYFDVSGVETMRELARAIAEGPAKADKLHFIFVFIGYGEQIGKSVPPDQHISATASPSSAAHTAAPAPPGSTPPERQKRGGVALNELIAPLIGLFSSRNAHEAHLVRELRRAPVPTAQVSGEWRPIMLFKCGKKFEPPMDWALSSDARGYIHRFTGLEGSDPCPPDAVSGNRNAILGIAAQIMPRAPAAGPRARAGSTMSAAPSPHRE